MGRDSTVYDQHISPHVMSESRTPNTALDPRCQSGPSARDSVIFSGGDASKNYRADQQRLQISDLHFDKFPTSATFACWKIRFKTEVCACSQIPTEAMHAETLTPDMRELKQGRDANSGTLMHRHV